MKLNPRCYYTVGVRFNVKYSSQPPWGKPIDLDTNYPIYGASSVYLVWQQYKGDIQDLTDLLSMAVDRNFTWANKSYYGILHVCGAGLGSRVGSENYSPPFVENSIYQAAYGNPSEWEHEVLLSANIIEVVKTYCFPDAEEGYPETIKPPSPPRKPFTRRFPFSPPGGLNLSPKITFRPVFNNNFSPTNNVKFNFQNNFTGNLGGLNLKQNNNININFNPGTNRFEPGGHNNNNYPPNPPSPNYRPSPGGNTTINNNNTINNIVNNVTNNDGGTKITIPVGVGFVNTFVDLSGELNVPIELPNGETWQPPKEPENPSPDEELDPVPDPEEKMVRIDLKLEYSQFIGLKFLTPQNRTYPEIGFYCWLFEDGLYSEWEDIREQEVSLLIPDTAVSLQLSITNGRFVSMQPYFESE